MNHDDSVNTGTINAGYTYFGQFIDHDLTLDTTPLDRARTDPSKITNFRTPFLDLDQLYGGGPTVSPFLYRKHGCDSPHGAERFLLGRTTTPTGEGTTENDLPRNAQGIALVGDARQDENLIVAQLHVAFLKLHNYVLKHPRLGPPEYEIESPFEAARRILTWHYQWLVRNDFLKVILDPRIFAHLVGRSYRPLTGTSGTQFQIPVEFSLAAFRFGHSMVRDEYLYNDFHSKPPAKLVDDLFQRTGFGESGNVPIPQEWVIDWERFFGSKAEPFKPQQAQRIDTKVAAGLFRLPSAQLRAFNTISTTRSTFGPVDPPELAIRTLLRGARMGLASGETAAAEIANRIPGLRFLTSDEIVNGPAKDILTNRTDGLCQNTPLWYYILKEAEVLGNGNHLGPVGSWIVGDVIIGALIADPNSYLNITGPDWIPTLFTPESGREPVEDEMSKFLKLVGSSAVTTGNSNT